MWSSTEVLGWNVPSDTIKNHPGLDTQYTLQYLTGKANNSKHSNPTNVLTPTGSRWQFTDGLLYDYVT